MPTYNLMSRNNPKSLPRYKVILEIDIINLSIIGIVYLSLSISFFLSALNPGFAHQTHQFGQRQQVRESKQGLGTGKVGIGIFPG